MAGVMIPLVGAGAMAIAGVLCDWWCIVGTRRGIFERALIKDDGNIAIRSPPKIKFSLLIMANLPRLWIGYGIEGKNRIKILGARLNPAPIVAGVLQSTGIRPIGHGNDKLPLWQHHAPTFVHDLPDTVGREMFNNMGGQNPSAAGIR